MKVAEKLTAVAENVPKVYEVGYRRGYRIGAKEESDWFWDTYQQKGGRYQYAYAFAGKGWTDETFRPKHHMYPTYAVNMFYGCQVTDLPATLDTYGVILDFGSAPGLTSVFNSSAITRIGEIRCASFASLSYTFANTSYLHTIEKLVSNFTATFPNAFYAATALENITFEGEIASDLDMHFSTKLTAESLTSIVNALKNMYEYNAAFAVTLTLGATNQAKLTNEQIATITEKGWTLA